MTLPASLDTWPADASVALFAAAAVPLSLLIGAASATVGFTAWMLIVPLAFAAFRLPLFCAIFLSLCVDGACGSVIAALYELRDRKRRSKIAAANNVNDAEFSALLSTQSSSPAAATPGEVSSAVSFRVCLALLVFNVAAQVPAAFASVELLSTHVSLLRGGVPYLTFVFALLFAAKSFNMWRKGRKAQREQASRDTQEAVRQKHESEYHGVFVGSGASSTIDDTASAVSVTSTASLGVNDEAYGGEDAPDATAAAEKWWQRSRRNWVLAAIAMAIGSAIMGGLSGLVGFGGGTWFAMLFVFILQDEMLTSTASGCFVMGVSMAAEIILYASGALGFPLFFDKLWPYLLICVGSAVVGASIGTMLTTRLAAWKLTAAVGAVLLLMGILTTAQETLIKHHAIK
jgi:uncharacterized membrane protein YfcA